MQLPNLINLVVKDAYRGHTMLIGPFLRIRQLSLAADVSSPLSLFVNLTILDLRGTRYSNFKMTLLLDVLDNNPFFRELGLSDHEVETW